MRRRGAPERACEFTHRLAVLHYLLGLVAIEAARELGLLPDPPLPPGIVGAGRISADAEGKTCPSIHLKEAQARRVARRRSANDMSSV